MGYIGLSAQDLSHMAYLSHYRSLPWITQAIHRVTRTDYNRGAPAYANQLARIFLPNDPRMCELAEQMMADQDPGILALPKPKPPVPPWPHCGPGGTQDSVDFETISASISGREFATNGERCHDHDFIEFTLRRLPEFSQVGYKRLEDFRDLVKNYGV
jgi:hypothetical protein